jgi:hypothetical protein
VDGDEPFVVEAGSVFLFFSNLPLFILVYISL